MNKRLKCEYSILPDFIVKNEKLNATEKILMSLIISLNLNNECYANNEYFSTRMNASKRTITNALKKLKDNNLIIIKVINYKRTIYLSNEVRNKLLDV